MRDLTETVTRIHTLEVPGGPADMNRAVDLLLNGALRAHTPDEPGTAWLEGEYRGEWIEVRVTIRPRPDKQTL